MRESFFAAALAAVLVFCPLARAAGPATFEKDESRIQLFTMQADFALPVLINSKTIGTFVLDAASPFSAVTPAMAQRLSLEGMGETRIIQTTQGVQEVPLVRLRSLCIGSRKITGPELVVINRSGQNAPLFSGILGRDILSHFSWRILENTLVLTPKIDTSGIVFN